MAINLKTKLKELHVLGALLRTKRLSAPVSTSKISAFLVLPIIIILYTIVNHRLFTSRTNTYVTNTVNSGSTTENNKTK